MLQSLGQFFNNYFELNLHGILNLAAGFFDISVGLLILLSNPKSLKGKAFFFVTLTSSIWVFCFGLISLSKGYELAMVFQAASYFFGVCFIPTSFLLFSISWLEGKLDKLIVWIALTWSVLTMLPMIFWTHTVVDLAQHSWGRYPYFQQTTVGIFYSIFLLVPFATIAGLSFRNFWIGWKNSISPRERSQFRNFLFGSIIAYTGAFDFLTTFEINYYPFGYLSLSVFIGVVAYTIIRHQFFEINILAKKFALFFLSYALLSALFFPLGSLFIKKIPPHQFPYVYIAGLLSGLFLSLGPVLYAFLQRHTFWLKSKTSTGLTHELKSPLGTIQSAVSVLLSQKNLEKKSVDYLNIIEKNSGRLEKMVNDLLNLAKIQNNDVSIDKTSTRLDELVNEVTDSYRLTAGDRGIKFDLQLKSNDTVEVDRPKIRQAISNIVSNAIKFSENSAVTIDLEPKGKFLLLSVTDRGNGIPRADLERIFTRFFHGKNSAKGSGIGLTIAKAWVEAHGGKIWAESEGEGKGARVMFTLPVQ